MQPSTLSFYIAVALLATCLLFFFFVVIPLGDTKDLLFSVVYYLSFILIGVVFLLSLFIFYEGDWFIPFLKGEKQVSLIERLYEIPATEDCIIRQENDTFIASVFLEVHTTYSTTEKTPEENVLMTKYFERALSSIRFVYKVGVLNYIRSVHQLREKIEKQKMAAQLRLSRARTDPKPDLKKIDRLEREVAMWDNQLARLSSGEKPRDELVYLMVSGSGPTRDAAIAKAKANASEVKTVFENALNTDISYLTGERMRLAFEASALIPLEEARLQR